MNYHQKMILKQNCTSNEQNEEHAKTRYALLLYQYRIRSVTKNIQRLIKNNYKHMNDGQIHYIVSMEKSIVQRKDTKFNYQIIIS